MQRILLSVSCLIFLAGCGQSGPLYLPGNPSEIRSAPTATSDSDEQEDDGEDATPKD